LKLSLQENGELITSMDALIDDNCDPTIVSEEDEPIYANFLVSLMPNGQLYDVLEVT